MWKPELMCIQFEDIKVDRLLIAEVQEMEKGGKSLRRRAAEKKSEREEKKRKSLREGRGEENLSWHSRKRLCGCKNNLR